MKKTLFLVGLLCVFSYSFAQEILWEENFSTWANADPQIGFDGAGALISPADAGITNWTLDVSNCTLSDRNDYVKIQSTSSGRLGVKDNDGDAIFSSSTIDISQHEDIYLELHYYAYSGNDPGNYTSIRYSIDGGAEVELAHLDGVSGTVKYEKASGTELQIPNGSQLKIIIKMNTTSADEMTINNLVVTGSPSTSVRDVDTEIKNPASQPAATISSLANDVASAVEVFRFDIEDKGAPGDNLPTQITRLNIENANTTAWSAVIEGASLRLNDGTEIAGVTTSISDTEISLSIPSGNLEVPNGDTQSLSLWIYLKTDITDQTPLQFQIPEAHQCLSEAGGSGLLPNITAVVSNQLTIDVVADRLVFETQPTTVSTNSIMPAVSVKATDAHGNTDIDFAELIQLTETAPQNNGLTVTDQTASAGSASFDDILFASPVDATSLTATSGTLTATSNSFAILEVIDQNSTIRPPASQPTATISSLANDVASAVEVFRFDIEDKGAPGDNLPTQIIRLNIENANTTAWSAVIEGTSLRLNDGTEIAGVTTSISDTEISLSIPSGNLEVPNGNTQSLSLWIYLKTDITDQTPLQFQIPEAHQCLSEAGGSGLLPNITAIVSNQLTIDVVADRLVFATQPTTVSTNSTMPTVSVKATDAHGNTDIDFAELIQLTETTPQNNGLTVTDQTATAGSASFDDILFASPVDATSLTATSGTLTATSNSFAILEVIDQNSTIRPPADIIPASDISPNQTQAIFNFLIEDEGGDGLPTKVTQLVFLPATTNSIPWTEYLQRVALKTGNNTIPTTANITDEKMTFSILPDDLNIAESGSTELTLVATLATSAITEGGILSIQIPQTHENKTTTTGSSSFSPSLETTLSSQDFHVEIVGSVIVIEGQATSGIAGSVLAPSFDIALRDEYGNLDQNSTASATLLLALGTDVLHSDNLTQNFRDGRISWNDLIYKKAENIQLQAKSNEILSPVSSEITLVKQENSEALISLNPVANDTISISRNGLNLAKEILRFRIKDTGGDGLPSLVESIKLKKGPNFTDTQLRYGVGGIILSQNNLEIGRIEGFSTSTATLQLTSPFSIAEGTEVEFSIAIYLSTHSNLNEGDIIEIMIDADDHGFTAGASGTGFLNDFEIDILSAQLLVDTKATQLLFETVPKSTSPDRIFSLKVAVVDENGNIDMDYNGTISLAIESGKGTLSTEKELTVNIVNGIAEWSDLSYDRAENFTLIATSSGFAPIISPNIAAVDATTTVNEPSSQIEAGIISSLTDLNSEGFVVFSIDITDGGEQDGLPTIPTKIVFDNAFPAQSANWEQSIHSAFLIADGEQLTTTAKITQDQLVFEKSAGLFSVPDGQTINIQLGLMLQKNNLEDKHHFKFQLLANNHNWRAHSTGSNLAETFAQDLHSALFTLEIDATQLDFVKIPRDLDSISAPFDLIVAARDRNGNIDSDRNTEVVLSLNGTPFDSPKNLVNGLASWTALSQNEATSFTLSASEPTMKEASQLISIGHAKMLLNDDFEQGSLDSWNVQEDWHVSLFDPIRGSYSLKHNLSNAIGESEIIHPIETFNLNAGTTVWRFQMKNGDWDPSSTNYMYYWLLADSENLATANGYAVGINLNNASDLLELWQIEAGKITQTLIQGELDWNAKDQAGIEVTRDNAGNWTLSYDDNGGFDNLYETGTQINNNIVTNSPLYTGVVFHYETASRSGELWLDDISIIHFNTAPLFDSVKVISSTKLQLFFSEEIETTTASQASHYQISDGINVLSAVPDSPSSSVILNISSLQTGTYTLSLEKLTDLAGIPIEKTSQNFAYTSPALQGDIIINEIMADPSPEVKLPSVEYVEIYNATDSPIVMAEWTLQVGSFSRALPLDTLQADEYAILCASASQAELAVYGKTILIPSFSALPNTGSSIALVSKEGLTIDQLTYSTSWYKDAEKKDGGWSLERIDPLDLSGSDINWTASVDERGGTPGEVNSVLGIILDPDPPVLQSLIPIDRQSLLLHFDEQIDTLDISFSQFIVSLGIDTPNSISFQNNGASILISFANSFIPGTTYTLNYLNLSDYYGNVLEKGSATFALPELTLPLDLIINEVLFNPVSGQVDYVELYNRSKKTIDLSTLLIANRNTGGEVASSTSISGEHRLLAPQEFVVLTKDVELVKAQYFVKTPEAMLEVKNLPSYPDKEGTVVVLNAENTIVDEFSYNENMHFGLLASKEGVSLERISYDEATNYAENWHSAASTVGYGTPTYQNSAASDLLYLEESEDISISPRVFSPNNDGIDDVCRIHYQFENPGNVANIIIFDDIGREVRKLARNQLLDIKGFISWDGLNNSGLRAKTGTYVIYIEIFDQNGRVQAHKKVCTLIGRFQ